MLKRLTWFFLWALALPTLAAETNVARQAGNTLKGDVKLYVLAPNDIVQIRVYLEPDLDTEQKISQDGTIRVALLGAVEVSGKTVEQATVDIHDLLAKDYLVNPQVSVQVKEFSKRRFTVLGQVQRPGPYEVSADQTVNLLEAIAMAGGYTRLASPSKITVQRMINGQQRTFKPDADDMARNRNSKPFEVRPGDVISVGERLI